MDVLVDTHILLWAWSGDDRLTKAQKDLLIAPEVRAFVSIVSLWEIAIKTSVGKLELKASLDELVASLPEFHLSCCRLKWITSDQFRTSPFTTAIPLTVCSLPKQSTKACTS